MLDSLIVPQGLFGSAIMSMQQHCEVKCKEDEALRPPPDLGFSSVQREHGHKHILTGHCVTVSGVFEDWCTRYGHIFSIAQWG